MSDTELYTRVDGKYVFPDELVFKEPFATVIPIRQTTYKVHRTESLANSALSYHKQGAKYKQVDGKWVKVWEFSDPTNCDTCNTLLDEERDRKRGYYGSKGDWYRSPLHRGTAIFAPFLCRNCYDKEDEAVKDRQKAKAFRAEQKRREAFDAQHKS